MKKFAKHDEPHGMQDAGQQQNIKEQTFFPFTLV